MQSRKIKPVRVVRLERGLKIKVGGIVYKIVAIRLKTTR